MWIRNHEGDFVFIDITTYNSEIQMYKDIWKIKFNIKLEDDEQNDFNNEIMRLINS